MTAESPLGEQIRGTRPDEYDTSQHASLMGMMKRTDLSWAVNGPGEHGSHYVMSVTEHHPRGLVASIFDPQISVIALLGKYVPRREGGPTHSVYLARLDAGRVAMTGGRVYDLDAIEPGVHHHGVWTPPTMTPGEALEDFELALSEARFD